MASSRTLVSRSDYAEWAVRFPEGDWTRTVPGCGPDRNAVRGRRSDSGLSPLGVPCNGTPFGTVSARSRSHLPQASVAGARWHHRAYGSARGSRRTCPCRSACLPTRGPRSPRAGCSSSRAHRISIYAHTTPRTGEELWKYPLAGGCRGNADDVCVARDRASIRSDFRGRRGAITQDRRLPDRVRGPQSVTQH